MQNIAKVITNGVRVSYYVPSMTIFSTQSAIPNLGLTVTPGATIHGNFKDPNNWTYTVRTVQKARGTIRGFQGNVGGGSYDYIIDGSFGDDWGSTAPTVPDWERTSVYNRALEKLNSKVRGNLDLAIDLAEAHTTGRMIRGIANVVDFARHPSRWSTRDLANGWLQWQYGWRPLISDIYDVCDQSSRIVRQQLTDVKASVKAPIRVNQQNTKTIQGLTYRNLARGEGKAACTLSVTLAVREWDPGQWSSLNPISLAWELIPYSFVVDWFVDVGSFMRNLESALLYNAFFINGYSSELFAYDGTDECNDTRTYLYGPDSFGTWRRIDRMWAKIRTRQFERKVLTSYPFPRKPTFKVDLGSQRLFSAAALLRQILSRV